MGQEKLPTFFIRNAERLESLTQITHYDLHTKQEVSQGDWLPGSPVVVGVTAGASCPNNLIEETILRLFELHSVDRQSVLAAVLA